MEEQAKCIQGVTFRARDSPRDQPSPFSSKQLLDWHQRFFQSLPLYYMQRFTCKELLQFLEAKAAVLPVPPPEKAIPSS